MKAHLAIYNLNGKVARWWRDLKHTKNDELREIWWSKFHNIFQEKYMSERFFDRKVKEFHELRMGPMTMDSLLTDFLICCIMYHTSWIRNFPERIEFDMPKTFDTTLHKYRLFYEHGQPRKENMNISRDMYRTFSDNCKLVFNSPSYIK